MTTEKLAIIVFGLFAIFTIGTVGACDYGLEKARVEAGLCRSLVKPSVYEKCR